MNNLAGTSAGEGGLKRVAAPFDAEGKSGRVRLPALYGARAYTEETTYMRAA